VPAFYIHSLLACANDYQAKENRGHNRAINRQQRQVSDVENQLSDPYSQHGRDVKELQR
jgi:sucrose phosphorylase